MVMATVMAMAPTARTLSSKEGGPVIMAATPAARAARWPLGFAAVVLAYWAFDYSLASNMRRANPEAAYRARPTDPGAVAAAMNDRMVARSTFEADADDAANARAGLGEDPLNRVLLRTLGVRAEITGRQQDAYRAMQMASRVSRRDSITELWLAEYHRRNNEPVKALVHYDAAMLVRPDLQKALFPQMVPALAQEDFRAAVRPYIVRKANWTYSFVGTAAAYGDMDVVLSLAGPVINNMVGGPHDVAFTRIINRLVAMGVGQRAKMLAEKFFPGLDMAALSVAGWNDTTTDSRMGHLAWKFEQTGQINSLVEEGGQLKLSVSPMASEEFASRTFITRPERDYRLSYRLAFNSGGTNAQVTWAADCASNNRIGQFWQERLPARNGSGIINTTIPIPSACTHVRLIASATGTESPTSSEVTIDRLNFDPVIP